MRAGRSPPCRLVDRFRISGCYVIGHQADNANSRPNTAGCSLPSSHSPVISIQVVILTSTNTRTNLVYEHSRKEGIFHRSSAIRLHSQGRNRDTTQLCLLFLFATTDLSLRQSPKPCHLSQQSRSPNPTNFRRPSVEDNIGKQLEGDGFDGRCLPRQTGRHRWPGDSICRDCQAGSFMMRLSAGIDRGRVLQVRNN